jgi:hypothetical protein
MGKRILFLMILPLLVFALVGVAQAWQGRMGGMADPYGLVADESDYLIHPAKIANGEGTRFYGDYRFTYTGVTDWDYHRNTFSLLGVPTGSVEDHVSGEELGHNGLVGISFPLGQGRMGLFLTYAGMRGGYDGTQSAGFNLQLTNDLDKFALRLLYGLPIGGGFKLGAEAQLAYCQEKQQVNAFLSVPPNLVLNEVWLPYPFPNNSRYWEALFKGSLEKKFGPLDLEFTLRGGFDFGGTSKYNFEQQAPPGTPIEGFDTMGDVQGWQFGGDLWLRYALATDLTLPFLVRVDYQTKTRDTNGHWWLGGFAGDEISSKDKQQNLAITAGGGVDKAFGKDTRIAAGIYYNYLQTKDEFSETTIYLPPPGWSILAYTFPDEVEHQLLFRLAGEHTLSPAVALRAGLNFFYGWMVVPKHKPRDDFNWAGVYDLDEASGDGSYWGIGASLGGTVKIKSLTLEPFVGGGWRQLHIKEHGVSAVSPAGVWQLNDYKIDRSEWYVSTGFSILYDF